MAGLTSVSFTSSGSWTAPAGVTKVMLIGHGGGGGGTGGSIQTGFRPYSGVGCTPYMTWITVVPNTTYTITVGSGGSGGVGRSNSTSQGNGGAGGNTTFGALYTFYGAPANIALNPNNWIPSNMDTGQTYINTDPPSAFVSNTTTLSSNVSKVTVSNGSDSGSYLGGFSGNPGNAGSSPGAGGNGNNSGVGTAGGNASGLGAGGGGGGCGSTQGGAGGNGAPGILQIIWVE